jgi:hypothetical protein
VGSESGLAVAPPPKRAKTFGSPAPTACDSASLMPPPTQRVFYSYMEQRPPEEEEFDDDDFNKYMDAAKQLKHEADVESAREQVPILSVSVSGQENVIGQKLHN